MQRVTKAETDNTPMQWSQPEDFEPRVRYNALNALGKLEPAALAQHAEAVVARLEDSDWRVRWQALVTLGKLDPAMLAQHVDAVVARLEDSDGHFRFRTS